jgi:hypothetical protein
MWEDLARLKAFEKACDIAFEDEQSFGRLVECKPPFDELLGSNDLVAAVNGELRHMLRDNKYYPQVSAERSITLIDKPEYKLFLTLLPPVTKADSSQARSLSGLTGHHVIGCVGGGPIRIMRCRRPLPHPHDTFSRHIKPSRIDDACLKPGESIAFNGDADLFSVLEASESLLMRLSTPDIGNLRWDYDIKTLEPIRAVAASLRDSRTEFAAEVLGRIGDQESASVLEALYEHPAHFVRWMALQSLGSLDYRRAFRLLHRAVDDEHPHVRAAARKTLDQLPEIS